MNTLNIIDADITSIALNTITSSIRLNKNNTNIDRAPFRNPGLLDYDPFMEQLRFNNQHLRSIIHHPKYKGNKYA